MAKKDLSLAYRIFFIYYKCYVPQHFLHSQEFIDRFGMPTSEDRDIDRELAFSPVLARLTTSEMADCLDQGGSITLYDNTQSVEIYELITAHIANWNQKVQYNEVGREPPIEDLRKLDALASELYKVARGYIEKSGTGNRLSNFFNKPKQVQRRSAEEKQRERQQRLPDKHTSITDKIAKIGFERRYR